jgi:hypothetical protein
MNASLMLLSLRFVFAFPCSSVLSSSAPSAFSAVRFLAFEIGNRQSKILPALYSLLRSDVSVLGATDRTGRKIAENPAAKRHKMHIGQEL